MRSTGRLYVVVVLVALAMVASWPRSLSPQSVQDRTPNLSGAWVGEPGVVHFNFLHRFDLVDTDGDDTSDKITNTPTFLLAVPLPRRLFLGINYASNSLVTQGEFNEWELLARWAPLVAEDGFPVDAGVTVSYNSAAESVDGEVAVTVPLGRLSLMGAGRILSDAFGSGDTRWAAGGGLLLHLHEHLALAGDLVGLTDLADDEDVAWGVGIQTRIPLTPHTLSIQATNARTATLQSASLGQGADDDEVLWGFEFTIPFTLSRYFGGGEEEERTATGGAAPSPEVAAEVTMTNQLRYSPGTVRIRRGETVRWRNTTPLIHTVTADRTRARSTESVSLPPGADAFDSGDLEPEEVYEHTFELPGEYRYFCVPHEGARMIGTVIVEG